MRAEDQCDVPGCTNGVANAKRGMCGACASSWYYWNRQKRTKPRGVVLRRKQKLEFWQGRLDWLYAPSGPPLRKKS